MRFIKWIAALILAILAALAVYSYDGLSHVDAEQLSVGAANYKVEILRDDWGVPHIIGERDVDTAFGLGFAHAEDDYETIQVSVAAARGVMSRYRGKEGAPIDVIVEIMDVWGRIDRDYETRVSPHTKDMSRAYAAGLNLYAARHPETTWAGLAPFTEQDVVAGFVMKTPFFYGFDGELSELFTGERKVELALDPDGGRDAFNMDKAAPFERGSNAFAVSAERSGDDITRLFINSHQPLNGPVAWYEAHTISGEGMNIQGGLFPGTPVILSGFNEHLGWANTVSAPDLTDTYRIIVNPDNADQYRLDGVWKDFTYRTAKLKVKLFGPFVFRTSRKIKVSDHGAVIDTSDGPIAVRFAGHDEVRQLDQYVALGRATNVEEFMAAMKIHALPSINYIYGDKDGNVGFIHNAQYPNRKAGWDYSGDLPGDRSDLIWTDYRPYSDTPMLFNPPSGFLYNANNTPVSATDGPGNLRFEDFPTEMVLQTNMSNRAMRILELTDGTSPIDREKLLAIKYDTGFAVGSIADEALKVVLAEKFDEGSVYAKALEHMRGWNMRLDVDSRRGALGGLTVLDFVTEQYTGNAPPTPRQAFISAVDYLMTHYGRYDPQWGDVNRLKRGDVNLPIDGGATTLRAVYPNGRRDDGQLHMTAGDSYIALIEWDEAGAISADVIHNFGSATLDETSPHHADQAPLFTGHKFRRALITEAEVRAAAAEAYRPGSRGASK
ncbi:penicillin acylase family protein [Robiginitomaculum antarcticum]|uniref:penicillin acylase family protein n=1 Tax=Robiginitomaculum antarcticum TaxID=437507 RepID=UPI0003797477|nr:penicillin acylase family protein [Robiginitomaculum antarcticum]